MTLASFRTSNWTLAFCGAGVALADWLFYGQPMGGNLVVFHFFLVLLAVLQTPMSRNRPPTLMILMSLVGLLFALAAQPGPLILFLFWLGLLAYLFTARHGWSTNTVEWLARWFHFGLTFLFVTLRDFILLRRWRRSGHGKTTFRRFGRELAKWVLPVAGSWVFLILFQMANPVLSYWFEQLEISVYKFFDSLALGPQRLFFWLFMAATLWAFCRARYRRRRFPELGPGKMLNPSLLVQCLTLFNAVFAVQTILDCVYLWGGAALPAGMTYAEYAHRGAYPLIATALLAGAFVVATFRAGLPTHETTLARRLVYLWLAQNVILTLNSLWRLHLYVEVYSLTRLRFAAAIWMLLVSAGIILILWRVYAGKSNAWLLNANFVSLIGVLYTCCFINFDATISRYNVEHSKEITGSGVYLDIKYLEQLGLEAIPALMWFQQNSSDPFKAGEAQVAAGRLTQQLNVEWQNWRSRTLRKHNLKQEVAHTAADRVKTKSIWFARLSVL